MCGASKTFLNCSLRLRWFQAMIFVSVAAPCAFALVTKAKMQLLTLVPDTAEPSGEALEGIFSSSLGWDRVSRRYRFGLSSAKPPGVFRQQRSPRSKLGSGVGEEESYLLCAVVFVKNRTRRNEDAFVYPPISAQLGCRYLQDLFILKTPI